MAEQEEEEEEGAQRAAWRRRQAQHQGGVCHLTSAPTHRGAVLGFRDAQVLAGDVHQLELKLAHTALVCGGKARGKGQGARRRHVFLHLAQAGGRVQLQVPLSVAPSQVQPLATAIATPSAHLATRRRS